MNLTITVNDMIMQVEGEPFELALFARSVGKAVVTVADAPKPVAGLKREKAVELGPPKIKLKKPRAKSTPTCRTCGGRGHRSNHCPNNV